MFMECANLCIQNLLIGYFDSVINGKKSTLVQLKSLCHIEVMPGFDNAVPSHSFLKFASW
jgi:hypothetical protein